MPKNLSSTWERTEDGTWDRSSNEKVSQTQALVAAVVTGARGFGGQGATAAATFRFGCGGVGGGNGCLKSAELDCVIGAARPRAEAPEREGKATGWCKRPRGARASSLAGATPLARSCP